MEPLKVILLGVNSYSFKDSTTNNLVSGCNVHFVNLENVSADHEAGFTPNKATLPLEAFDKFKEFPYPTYADAYYTFDFRGKKPTIKFIDFEPIEQINVKTFTKK